ncbi:MAG TPA: M20/M25/M40 family metallo-hydrolase [Bacteroidia bacterium]|nr:M20/M25/M40 family metallo-hydrolase [Bacteroidia bacterium]
MYKKTILSALLIFLALLAQAQNKNSDDERERDVTLLVHSSYGNQPVDSIIIKNFYDLALTSGKAYEWLDTLSNKIGARLSGSKEAAQAVDWGEKLFRSLNVNVIKQECMVPHWYRGNTKEQATIFSSYPRKNNIIGVPICALGGSIATPANGISAKVIEIKNFEELEKLGRKNIEGKIVFYNRPMDATQINTFSAYGNAVDQRWAGAMKAAPYGAVGVVVRSMSLSVDDYPHTGSMGYNDTIPKIPACAISTRGANLLSELLQKDPETKFLFKQACKTLPDEKSYNVIGEIKGTEHPEEIIVVGGHLDSWDLGDGAVDDGAGIVQSAEVLNLFNALGIKPKRTIRAVMFMNEENGSKGGEKYAELAKQNNEKHIFAIESDAGGTTPRGFSFKGDSLMIEKLLSWKKLFEQYNLYTWFRGYGGADIDHLEKQCPVLSGLSVDSQRYFDYHHAATDTFDKINRRELELGAASMAALIYLISEHGLK